MKIGGLEICFRGTPRVKRYEELAVFSYRNDAGEIVHESSLNHEIMFSDDSLNLLREATRSQLIKKNEQAFKQGERGVIVSKEILYKQY